MPEHQKHGGVQHEHNYQEIDPMSVHHADNHGDSQSADPSGELSKIGFYCLISSMTFLACFTTLYAIPVIKKLIGNRQFCCNSCHQQLITQLLSCVGAGALLGLAMIDILPELREKISSIPKERAYAGSHSAHAESSSRHSDFHSEEEESRFFSDHYPLAELGMLISTFIVAILDVFIQRCFQFTCDQFDCHRDCPTKPKIRIESGSSTSSRDSSSVQTDSETQFLKETSDNEFLPQRRPVTKPIIGKITKIIAGLSLHSVLTGMSIGMRDSNEHMIAGIIGIIPHKVAVLIILSTLTLEINRISRFVHITIFSAALPVGILISIGVSKLPEGLFVCSLEALGCGAVFYVAVLEMLPDSLEGGWTVLKYLTVLAGIGIMAIIQASHSHSHGSHDDHHFGHATIGHVVFDGKAFDSSGADFFEGFSVSANEDIIPVVDIGNQSAT
jgi:hypothetical protein